MQGLRGARAGELTEKQYDIIDAVGKVAAECNTDSSTVALAWLKAQSGVQSTIIGARTLEQPEANLKALDLTLTPEQIASLDDASKPVLNFPADFLTRSPSLSHAGATVNGIPSQLTFLVPKDDGPRW
jgi:diketogulonate reductase-like aldo/keto reductase